MLKKDEVYSCLKKYNANISLGSFVGEQAVELENASVKRSAASLIKLFLLYYVLKYIPAFDRFVSHSDIDLAEDTILRFFGGSTLNIEALLALMIDVSDNSVSNYLLDRIGMNRMNEFLLREGFHGTSFGRHFLDNEARKSGKDNFTSVIDLHHLIHGILEGNLLDDMGKKLFIDLLQHQFDRSKFDLYLPESLNTGGKSGMLNNVWSDFIFFYINGKVVYLIALTEDMPGIVAREFIPSYSYHFCRGRFPGIFQGDD